MKKFQASLPTPSQKIQDFKKNGSKPSIGREEIRDLHQIPECAAYISAIVTSKPKDLTRINGGSDEGT